MENNLELKEWQKTSLELRSKGFSSRAICRELGWEETKKSTINSFLQRYDALNEIVDDVNKLNILYWDIETSPTVSAHWGQWQQNIPYVAKVRDGHMLSHAWAWNDSEVQASVLTHLEAKEADDERLVLEMWSLFDKADVIVGHNVKKFDVAKANASFLKYGMKPPSPYKMIDTLTIARKKFNLPFKNLDFLCQYLNLPYQKVKHEGMGLWMKCMEGDVEALTTMKHYNIGDIPTLRELYKRLSVWDNNSVNFGTLLGDRSKCPSCASDKLTDTNNFVYTSAKGYSVFRCECGALCKQTKQGFSLI